MLKRMFPYMHKYRKYLWLSCFCVVAETVFELVIPLLMADIIDVGVANQDKTYILLQGSKMIACALLALILGALSNTPRSPPTAAAMPMTPMAIKAKIKMRNILKLTLCLALGISERICFSFFCVPCLL